MIHLANNPGQTAQAIVDTIEAGRITTAGQWQDVITHIQYLPPRLRAWTLAQIRAISGDVAADYLQSRMVLARRTPACQK